MKTCNFCRWEPIRNTLDHVVGWRCVECDATISRYGGRLG